MSDACSKNSEPAGGDKASYMGRLDYFLGAGFFLIGILLLVWGSVPLGDLPAGWVEFSQQVDWGIVTSGLVFLLAGGFFLKNLLTRGLQRD